MPVISTPRTSLADKLRVLGRGASPQATLDRLDEYRRLFAFRYSGGIVTRVGRGPRAWTKLPGRLGTAQVVRHLLADRVAGLEPVWFGARGLSRSRWFCIDVDADRTPEQLLDEGYDLGHADADVKAILLARARRAARSKPPFADRLARVERALRRLGVDPADPRQVLALPTPGGGRHLYVFLDGDYHLEVIHGLLEAAGLTHSPGEVELFPAVCRALRLPFGFLPGRPHDPDAWIQFVDDYRNGRVRRFPLAALHDHLDRHRDRWVRQLRSRRDRRTTPTRTLGVPKTRRVTTVNNLPPTGLEIRTAADAEYRFARGIDAKGTRNRILNQLAAHLIWFRHRPAADAAAELTAWAMDPRHASEDIAADLANGTRKVPAQIARMCRWYEARKQTSPRTGPNGDRIAFGRDEVESLRTAVSG